MSTSLPGLLGRSVLVTGGTSGIGQATAVRFAEHGANVAINYLATPDEAAGTEEQVHTCLRTVRQHGVRDVLVQGDISSEEDVVRMAARRASASAASTPSSITPASGSHDRPRSSPAPSSTRSLRSTCAARSCAPARRSSDSSPTRSAVW